MTGRLRLTLLHSPEILNVKKHVPFFFIPGQAELGYSDIPAGEGKIANIFLQCRSLKLWRQQFMMEKIPILKILWTSLAEIIKNIFT